MSSHLEEIPYGPLSISDYERLSTSYFYDDRPEVQEVARERGVGEDELLYTQLGQMLAANQLARRIKRAVEAKNV